MRLEYVLSHRHAFRVVIVVALILCLPMLGSGLFLDDYVQRIAMYSAPDSNLFDFFSRGSPLTEARMTSGILPWWHWDDAKVQFFRPIGELLIRLDYALWPDNFALMHLHSIAWYGALIGVVAMLYRQLLPLRWVAVLATLLFAVDYGHAAGVAWLCNRNVLVAMILSLLCLHCHRRGTRWMLVIAAGLFAVSLAASEAALAISGYLLAHELLLTQHSPAKRILRLLPYALIGLGWISFWFSQGYGVSGPGFYIDIAHQPLLFMEKLLYRAPAYLISQLALPPVEVFGALELPTLPDALRWLAMGLIAGLLALLVWLLRPLLKQSPMARFFALGMVIAALPIAASSPVSRSLWYVSFGALGLVAMYIAQAYGSSRDSAPLKRTQVFAKCLLVIHLLLSPLLFLLMPQFAQALDAAMDSETVALPAHGEASHVLVLSSPSYIGSVTFPLLKNQALSLGAQPSRQRPTLVRVRGLVDATQPFTLERLAADRLRVHSAHGFAGVASQPYAFAAGHRVSLDDVQISIERVNAHGQPVQIAYDFHAGSLATYRVLRWQDDALVPATLPAIGRSVTIE
ncbi:hypothetical protein DFR26_0517 [Paraperlucidibaca baekdonensis]|uniref:Dolichyl-phosphate-mannose-protein mannosyltransferase n=1 Tax=Paraperlucidibaca baekdonensis TaxID=748120 RepID=A0A3E0H9F6_9GAMM|nr:hypothetical protein [Paraperlucidibaca baekdonensis]REH40317.1 hypothetical protein DFR26_0517 [Paraperlucidibaca baekdonensis]